MRLTGRLVVAVALLMSALPAHAGLGDGIRVGGSEGRLHPFVELELRYDDNVAAFYNPSLKAGDLILHVRPGLQLTVPGDNVAVDLMARLDWAQYFGLSDPATKDLSNLFADASLGVGFNRKGQLGLELDEKFTRSNQPASYSIASGVISNYNDLSIALPWRPGGKALTLTLAGDWTVESYDAFKSTTPVCDPAVNPFCSSTYLANLGYNNIGASLDANWKFLPKTAALLDIAWFDRIPNSSLYSIGGTGLRAQAGLSGLITTHLAGTVKAGYGTTLGLTLDPLAVPQADLSSLSTWLATVSFEWIPSSFSSLKLTWNHDFGFDPGTTWALYTINHLSLAGKSRLNSVWSVALTVDGALLAYRDPGKTTAQVLTARPAVQADVARWLMLELAYQYTNRNTDLTAPPVGWKYSINEVWLRGVVTY